MKIIVLGATSNTGQAILKELANTDYQVSVYVRNAFKLPVHHTYQVIVGDMLEKKKLTAALKGQEVVIAGLSGKNILQMAQNLSQAAQKQKVRHIYWITGMGIHHEVKGFHGLMLNALAKSMPDYVAAADEIANTSVTSTLLRLPNLTDGDQTSFHISRENEKVNTFMLSRKALAKAIVYLLDRKDYDNDSIAITL